MVLNHSDLDTQNLVVINLDRETVNFKKINFVNCVDSSPPPDRPAANQMPVEIMSQPAYQSVGQDSRSANSIEIPDSRCVHSAAHHSAHRSTHHLAHHSDAPHSTDHSDHSTDLHSTDLHSTNHHSSPAPVLLDRIDALTSHPASEPSTSSSSGGGEDSLPIVNTPDSGINHSRSSLDDGRRSALDGEMASSNRTPDDDRSSVLPTNELTDELNNDLNSNQLNDPISQLIKNGKMDYDSEERVHFDFLTASQLQKIIDHYKGRFKEQHAKSTNSISSSDSSFNNLNAAQQLNSSTSSKGQPTNGEKSNPQVSSCFGCSLSQIEKLTGGLVLPTFIEFMILYLMKNGVSSVGVFRKSGVRSRINSLRKYCDSFFILNHNALSSTTVSLTSGDYSFLSTNPLMLDALSKQQQKSSNSVQSNQKPFITLADLDSLFTEFSVYDVADTIKTWLREIKPKPLITKEIILAFKDFSSGLNTKERFCFDLVSLMNDTERYVLLIILNMLSWFAVNSSLNQMNAHNLAICFAPSLCEMVKSAGKSVSAKQSNQTSRSNQSSPLRSTAAPIDMLSAPSSLTSRLLSNSPNVNDLKMSASSSADSIYANENECLVDAQKCLQYLIEHCSSLQMFSVNSIPFQLNVTNSTNSIAGYDNNNGSVYFLNEGNLLPQTYESSVLISACPMDILERLLYERNLIDPTIIEWEIEVESDIANEQHDIFTMKKQCSLFLPVKTFTLKRAWSYFDQSDQQAGKKSAKENKAKQKASKHEKYTQQGILLKEEGFLYQSLYKITTAGEGKSCVQQSLAYDLRGHSFHWYQHVFPTIIDYQLNMLKQTFQVDYLTVKNVKSSSV